MFTVSISSLCFHYTIQKKRQVNCLIQVKSQCTLLGRCNQTTGWRNTITPESLHFGAQIRNINFVPIHLLLFHFLNMVTPPHQQSTGEIIIDYEPDSYKKQTQEFFRQLPHIIKEYIISLFPIATWIHRYNLQWLLRDIIAGVTVGVVVVPQSMGYAKIAQLPAQYGL
jgi:hypothetical protein